MTRSLQNSCRIHEIDENAVTNIGVADDSAIALWSIRPDGYDSNVEISIADDHRQINSACSLVNKMYGWRGYGSDHHLTDDAVHATFMASSEGEVIGTITLAVDSPSGLAVDKTFPDEMEEFRRDPGARLCELTKFAFDANASSKQILAALFHVVLIYGGSKYRCTDLFIEVNPRHVRFYEGMLGFARVGALKTNDSVAAPSQLMRLKVDQIRARIDRHAGEAASASARSLYPFFFSKEDERQIYARLAARYALRPSAWNMPPHWDPRSFNHSTAAPSAPIWVPGTIAGAAGRMEPRPSGQ